MKFCTFYETTYSGSESQSGQRGRSHFQYALTEENLNHLITRTDSPLVAHANPEDPMGWNPYGIQAFQIYANLSEASHDAYHSVGMRTFFTSIGVPGVKPGVKNRDIPQYKADLMPSLEEKVNSMKKLPVISQIDGADKVIAYVSLSYQN